MGWFSEQIRQRAENDRNVLEDSFFRMASAVMDKWSTERMEDERLITREAIDDILKYYRHKPADIPESMPSTLSIVISAVYPTEPSDVVPDLSISVIVPVNVFSRESIVTSADWPFEIERMSVSSTETVMIIFLSGQISK